MNTKKIGIIILALALTGGIAGGFGYKLYSQEKKPQNLKVHETTEVKTNSDQAEVNSNSGQNEVKHVNKETEIKNEQAKARQEQIKNNQPNKKELIHSNFESKIQSYIAKFREQKLDIYTFKQNLDNLYTKDLSTEDKKQLDNTKLALNDWSVFTQNYVYLNQVENPHSEESMKYVGEALYNVNTKNLVATGLMSQATVDKYNSFFTECLEKRKQELDKEEQPRDKELDRQHAELKTTEEKEKFYYNLINEAMQKQIKYINSIKDPYVKSSVQSSIGAAVGMETYLELLYPEDSNIIMASFKKVTASE